jgi:hypothetical protein
MNPHAADCRRATALVVHYGAQNLEGVDAVLKEAVTVNRVMPLITSVLDLHESVVPLLLTQDGLACLTQMIYTLADDEDGDQDCRRAARLVIRHDRRDAPGINAVLKEAAEADRVTELVVGLLSLYSTLVPMLYSQLGLQVLQRSILDWAAREDAG